MPERRTLPTVPTIAAFVLVAVVLSIAAALAMRPRGVPGARPIGLASLGRPVLVIATHPDDESLTVGGAISELVARGAQVRVVIVTAGDAYPSAASRLGSGRGRPTAADYLHLGEVRHLESLAAAARLGLAPGDVISLGYADRGATALWTTDWDRAHPYTGSSGDRSIPYAWAYSPGGVECGQDLATALATIVRDFKPDTVISPDTRETNADHAAVAAFTLYALDDAGFTGSHLTSIVHFRGFPAVHAYLPGSTLAPPSQLLGAGATWLTLPLGPPAEAAKLAAIDGYRSQTSISEMGVIMRSFVRTNDLFCRRPASIATTTASDARPGAGDVGAIAVTPSPVLHSARIDPARILALRMIRGPQTLWIGFVCAGPVPASADFRLDLRLLGGSATPQRLEVLVRGGRAQALNPSANDVVPGGMGVSVAGDTVWLSVPASVLDGRTRAIAGSSSALAGFTVSRTPWVDVRL
jgi:LmbE family N-acetylglucosaminyl deacetylase